MKNNRAFTLVELLAMLVVLGIKYITSAPNEKADIKKSLMYYVVGALLVFAGPQIVGVIYRMATQIDIS